MSTITYDNLGTTEGLVTFSHVPNIIKIEEAAYDGVKASLQLTFSASALAGQNGQTITVGTEVITSVDTLQSAVNRNFYISNDNSATAYSVMRALRACPALSAGYDIWMADYDGASVTVRAKDYGPKYNIEYGSTLPANSLTVVKTDGSLYNSSSLESYSVDIFSGGDYITTLTKNAINDVQHFDVSPVLATLTDYGRLVPYELKIHGATSDCQVAALADFSGYACYGYRLRGSADYLNVGYSCAIAAKDMTRYLYTPIIDFSVINFSQVRWTAVIRYMDSAGGRIGGAETVNLEVGQGLSDIRLSLSPTRTMQSYRVEVETPAGVQSYKVIKPLKAAPSSQRIWWRNEYGGISFFDFTGQRTEKRSLSETDYQPSYYDYYDQSVKRLDMTFSRDVETSISLTSHLIGGEGLDIFRSLDSSHYVWTRTEGKDRLILITDMSINQISDVDDTYTVTITYRYSMRP